MAGVINNTARQLNIKIMSGENRKAVVRLAPGFNIVEDLLWKKCEADAYVKRIKKEKMITSGKAVDDMELDEDPKKKATVNESSLPVKKD